METEIYKFFVKENNFKVIKLEKDSIEYKMQNFIGQTKAKEMITNLLAKAKINQKKQNLGIEVESMKYHALFQGTPGTGKTTLAIFLGKELRKAKLLSSGHFVVATKADLVGSHLGHTEEKVRRLVERAIGGVLFIDEAYNLLDGESRSTGHQGFGQIALNTLMEDIDRCGNDIMLILAGYPDKMKEVLKSNEGYSRRIPFKIDFEDFSEEELIKILKLKLEEREYKYSEEIFQELSTVLKKAMSLENFGNAGFVEILVDRVSLNIDRRLSLLLDQGLDIEKEDFKIIKKQDLRGIEDLLGNVERAKNKKIGINND